MFDNPKKELERLEQQLLAAEAADTEEDFEELYEEEYEVFDAEDDELMELLGRSAGFDSQSDELYDMEENRYAAPPKKKGIRGLLMIACLEAIAIIALAVWWLRRLL